MALIINGTTGFSPESTGFLVGQVCYFAQEAIPTGFLACEGAAVSRTTYVALFGAIDTNYGVGDGSTTFNLPDLRGEFIRGYDAASGVDPDASSRTDRGDGTTGDNVGTKQAGQYGSHDHGASGTHTHQISMEAQLGSSTGTSQMATGSHTGYGNTQGGGNHTHTANGGNETRARNIGLLPAIFTGIS